MARHRRAGETSKLKCGEFATIACAKFLKSAGKLEWASDCSIRFAEMLEEPSDSAI